MPTTALDRHWMLSEFMALVPGMGYRKLDYWIRKGAVPVDHDGGSGFRRFFNEESVACARLIEMLVGRVELSDERVAEIVGVVQQRGAAAMAGHAIVICDKGVEVVETDALIEWINEWEVGADSVATIVDGDRLVVA